MKYFGFITVRTSSARLKKKCLLKFGEINVIEHVILRAKKNSITPLICTTTNKSDNIIEHVSKKYNVKLFRGSEKNKIKRWHDCAFENKIKYFHTIDADDPFFDPVSIKKSINICKFKYDIIFPSKISRLGGASEGYTFSFKAIEKINNFFKNKYKSYSNLDTEMIEKFINKKKFKIKTLRGSSYEIRKARLTLDYAEDYKMLKIIRDNCGNFATRKKINFFLKRNKDILKINYFRTYDWKKKQKKLLSNKC